MRIKTTWQNRKQQKAQAQGHRAERTHQKLRRIEKLNQKMYSPTFVQRGIQKAKLRWSSFTQYIKMTQNIDLNVMTNDREILQEHRDELEHRIKDLFIWELGESAITGMTRAVRDNDPNKMEINQVYSLFRLHVIPERNKFHSRAYFFG